MKLSKVALEYHVYFLIMLIATVLSAFIIPNPYMRGLGVAVFAILCHLFGTHEGRLAERRETALREAAEKAAAVPEEGHANDESFALKP